MLYAYQIPKRLVLNADRVNLEAINNRKKQHPSVPYQSHNALFLFFLSNIASTFFLVFLCFPFASPWLIFFPFFPFFLASSISSLTTLSSIRFFLLYLRLFHISPYHVLTLSVFKRFPSCSLFIGSYLNFLSKKCLSQEGDESYLPHIFTRKRKISALVAIA